MKLDFCIEPVSQAYIGLIIKERSKYYNVEIIANGKSVGMDEVESVDIIDNKTMQGFLATNASLTDLMYYKNSLRQKDFGIITSLMATIPVNNRRYIFS